MIRLKDFWQKIKAELLTDKDVVLALIVEKKALHRVV